MSHPRETVSGHPRATLYQLPLGVTYSCHRTIPHSLGAQGGGSPSPQLCHELYTSLSVASLKSKLAASVDSTLLAPRLRMSCLPRWTQSCQKSG